MIPRQRLFEPLRKLHTALGLPGLIIGSLSFLSFCFGLLMLAREYDRPRVTNREALRKVIGGWVRYNNYLGYTLIDYIDQWRSASPAEAASRAELIRTALNDLGNELAHHDSQFPLVQVYSLDLLVPGRPPLARWSLSPSVVTDDTSTLDIPLPDSSSRSDHRSDTDGLLLRVRFQIVSEVESAISSIETSYHRLLMAVLGLSGYSLLCLGYMAFHARALSQRAAVEAAREATLDLADRTCHELGNVAFVVANERRNLASHIELLERFVAEDSEARRSAARRAGLEPGMAARFEHALGREYADRGIDPDLELRGSVEIARSVCRQIATCSDYIALTVRELDGYLKRTSLPVDLTPVSIEGAIRDAITLLAPRLEALDARIETPDPTTSPLQAVADRRLLIHALVNLIKNAAEAASAAGRVPEIRVTTRTEPPLIWVEVSDNGPGIPPNIQARLFEPGTTTNGPGRGKGLSIVQESVEAQKGHLNYQSPPGQGATFRIGLPLAHTP